MPLIRILVAAVAAMAAWWAGLAVVFGPAQRVLSDPDRQSAKFLAAFTEPPVPRMVEQPMVLFAGLFLVALIYSGTYSWLAPKLPGGPLRRSLTFGLLAWTLMVPWFELYLPYNVMREPFTLVLLEGACWLVVLLFVGLALGLTHAAFDRGRSRLFPPHRLC